MDMALDAGLSIRPDGRPATPLRRIALDNWHAASEAEIARAAAQVSRSLSLTIGVATREPPQRLRPLLDALTTTLAGPDVAMAGQHVVAVPDPEAAWCTLADTVNDHPQSSLACAQLLRQTALLDTISGLAAEAAVYSMLLGGTEFARWRDNKGSSKSAEDTGRPLVRVIRDGSRLSIVLDRPERRNAFSFGMREALFEALELATHDDTIDHVGLSGAGPAFCSGGDLAEFGTATDLVAAYLVRLDRSPWRLMDQIRDRIQIHVHGAAVGAGIEMAAFARRVVAAPDSFFLLPEISMGLVPGAGGTVSVPRRIGRWRAAWMMLSGCRVDTAQALDWGLIDEIAEP